LKRKNPKFKNPKSQIAHPSFMSYMFLSSLANSVATELVDILSPHCDRIQIVGSLRRNASTVHDVDLLAIPRFAESEDSSLFGEPVMINLLDRKLADFCHSNVLQLISNGPKVKRFVKHLGNQQLPIDIYIATPETWWTHLLIRTGSKEHNIQLVMRAVNIHMQLKADGSGLLTAGGSLIQIQSEQEIFTRLGLPHKPPEERN
jgi:DNA polymerase/3'-5' exonuclease PolX